MNSRRISIAVLAVAAMASASCTKEVVKTLPASPSEFMAGFENSKTCLVEGTKVYWTAGDQINFYAMTDEETPATIKTGATYSTSITEASASAAFTGSGATICPKNSMYTAFYPVSAMSPTKGWTASSIFYVIPHEQIAVNGGIPESCNFMVAASANASAIFFRQYNAYMKFTIGAESPEIVSVNVVANADEHMSGDFKVELSSLNQGETTFAGSVQYSDVLLKSSDGNALPAGSYYLALKPGNYASGLTFNFKRSDGAIATKTISSAVDVAAGTIIDYKTVRNLSFNTVDPASKLATVYNKPGDAKGVIFWVNEENPYEGMAISAWGECKAWSTKKNKVGVSDTSLSGEAACSKIRAASDYGSAENVYALTFCDALGEGWRLPTKIELNRLFNTYWGRPYDAEVEASTFYDDSDASKATDKAAARAAQVKFEAAMTSAEAAHPLESKGGNGDSIWTCFENSAGENSFYVRLISYSGSHGAKTGTARYVRCVKKVNITY